MIKIITLYICLFFITFFALSQTTKYRLDSLISDNYNETYEYWDSYYKEEFIYVSENLSQYLCYQKPMNEWNVIDKNEYIYDSNNNLTNVTEYQWDASDCMWDGYRKYDYSYDENGNMIQEIFSIWDNNNNQWLFFYKYVNTFNDIGKWTKRINYKWNETENTWDDYISTDFTFNVNGDVTDNISYIWNTDISQWVNYTKAQYTLDLNGNRTLSLYFDWNENTNQWDEFSKREFTYDENENITVEIFYQWNDISGEIEPRNKSEYSYNNDYLLEDLIVSSRYAKYYLLNHMLLDIKKYKWNTVDTQFDLYDKVKLHYSEQSITGISNNNELDIKVYPNPTQNFIKIEIENNLYPTWLEIINVNGKIMINQEISGNNEVSVSHLNTGLYIYKIILNGHTQIGRIIIK